MSEVPEAAGEQRQRRLTRLTAASAVVVLSLGVATAAQRNGLVPATEVMLQQPFGGSAGFEQADGSANGEASAAPVHLGELVEVPTHDLGYLPEVVLVGVLRGDPAVDGGCLWLEMDDVPQAVRWSPGFRAHFDPSGARVLAELLDEEGQVRAREGETVYFTGARSGAAERLDRCHVGADHVWYVGEVTTESPFD